jgi:hypothetical protein
MPPKRPPGRPRGSRKKHIVGPVVTRPKVPRTGRRGPRGAPDAVTPTSGRRRTSAAFQQQQQQQQQLLLQQATRNDNKSSSFFSKSTTRGGRRQWIQVKRPPAKGVSFQIPMWVPVDQLTPQEAFEYSKSQPTPVQIVVEPITTEVETPAAENPQQDTITCTTSSVLDAQEQEEVLPPPQKKARFQEPSSTEDHTHHHAAPDTLATTTATAQSTPMETPLSNLNDSHNAPVISSSNSDCQVPTMEDTPTTATTGDTSMYTMVPETTADATVLSQNQATLPQEEGEKIAGDVIVEDTLTNDCSDGPLEEVSQEVTADITPNLTTVPATTPDGAIEHPPPPPPQEAMETQPEELPTTTTTATETREELETQTTQEINPMEEERTDSQVVVEETNL